MNNKITLIFQGRLGVEIIDMIKKNIDNYKIVVVTNDIFNDSNKEILNKLDEFSKITLIKYYIPIDNVNNESNMYYQFYSTYLGLCNSETEYSIKFRADEYFENIEPLTNFIINNPDKIVTSDFLFRKTYLLKYNISDHYIGGKTDILLSSFKTLVKHCKDVNKLIDGYSELSLIRSYSPEKKIAISILRTMGVNISFNNIIVGNIINKYFHIFDSDKLGSYIFSNNCMNKKITNDRYSKDNDKITTIISNNEIYRYCNLDSYNKKIIFLFGNNSIFDKKYEKIFDIISLCSSSSMVGCNETITIYSNDNINISNMFKANIVIDNYINYVSMGCISSDILFVVDNDAVNMINKKKVYTNNLFLVLTNNIIINPLDLIDIVIGCTDYVILLNPIVNINDTNTLYKNKLLEINNIVDHIDIKIDNEDIYIS